MKTRKLALAAIVAAAAITMAGCSASPVPAPTASPAAASAVDSPPAETSSVESAQDTAVPNDAMPEFFEQGDFYFVTNVNVVGKFTIPGKKPSDLESLRKAAAGSAVSYLEVKLDARQATDGANMFSLTMFDPAGKKYVFSQVNETISKWRDLNDPDDVDLYNRYVNAENAEAYHIEQSEVGTIRMVSTSTVLPTKITRIAVEALGAGDETEAYPVSMGQGLNLDF